MNSLPIPVIDPDDPADVARRDEIATCVETLLRLHRELRDIKGNDGPEEEKYQQYQTDILDADRRIDALVYELYGLTAAEIRIIEAD